MSLTAKSATRLALLLVVGVGIGVGAGVSGLGCGFAGDAQFSAQELPDVTRYSLDVPVEICEGASRLGAIGVAPLGWCGLDTATAPGCDDDGDCRSRERCLCGACVVAPCDANDECGEGRICDFNDRRCDRACTNDADCDASEICLPGRNVCRGRCSDDAACQSGERCDRDRGRCVTDACSGDTDCGGACAILRAPAELVEPSVVVDANGALQLWFEQRTPTGPQLRVARGTDGVRFVAAEGSVASGAAPSAVALPDGSVDLVWEAEGGVLVAARYADGALGPGLPIETGGATYRAPTHLVEGGDRFVIARRGSDGAVVALDGSVAIDAAAFVAPPYVLTASAVASPFLEQSDGVERLWLTLRGVESGPSIQFGAAVATPENDSIALAVRRDRATPFAPFPYNPVLARTESITMHPFERAPSTVVYRGARWLYYDRAGFDGATPQNLRVARSP